MISSVLLALTIVAATAVAIFSVYFFARFLLSSEPEERTRDLAGSILFRIAALHGLVLALVFASEVVEYNQVFFESAVETTAVSDAYYDADRYGDEDAVAVQNALRAYLDVVVESEWDLLGEANVLSPDAWQAWNDAYNAALDLSPANLRQETLRDNILSSIDTIAENRDLREHHAKSSLGALFWGVALVGVVLVSVGYYPFEPKRDHLVLLGVFAVYTGLILFTIYAMSNPYSGPGALEPTLFQDLIKEIESAQTG